MREVCSLATRSLAVMTALPQCFPVRLVPEQVGIAAVRYAVIDDRRRLDETFAQAFRAQWIRREKHLARRPPPRSPVPLPPRLLFCALTVRLLPAMPGAPGAWLADRHERVTAAGAPDGLRHRSMLFAGSRFRR
jgi:hypothetical protein